VTARVDSVNGPDTVALLEALQPSLVVLNGTRVVSAAVLDAMGCPCINTHAGITPRYRGVHGGYWALAEGHPELVGTTVHLVDRGIDTGGVLGRAYFDVEPVDTIATYPYLHLAAGLPDLASHACRVLDGEDPVPDELLPVGESRLYLHPTLWAYLYRRLVHGVR
jgi:methionyl-tRNA formyltransferase